MLDLTSDLYTAGIKTSTGNNYSRLAISSADSGPRPTNSMDLVDLADARTAGRPRAPSAADVDLPPPLTPSGTSSHFRRTARRGATSRDRRPSPWSIYIVRYQISYRKGFTPRAPLQSPVFAADGRSSDPVGRFGIWKEGLKVGFGMCQHAGGRDGGSWSRDGDCVIRQLVVVVVVDVENCDRRTKPIENTPFILSQRNGGSPTRMCCLISNFPLWVLLLPNNVDKSTIEVSKSYTDRNDASKQFKVLRQ